MRRTRGDSSRRPDACRSEEVYRIEAPNPPVRSYGREMSNPQSRSRIGAKEDLGECFRAATVAAFAVADCYDIRTSPAKRSPAQGNHVVT